MASGTFGFPARASLAQKYPSAAEGLRFYGHIAQFQKSLYDDLEIECGKEPVARLPGMLRQELDLFILLPRFGVISVGGGEKLARAFGTGRRVAAREWWNALAGNSDQLLASRFAIELPTSIRRRRFSRGLSCRLMRNIWPTTRRIRLFIRNTGDLSACVLRTRWWERCDRKVTEASAG